MATITQLPSKHWQARIRMKGLKKSKVFSTRGKAVRWARQLETEHDYYDNDSALIRAKRKAESMTLHDALIKYRDEISIKKAGYIQEKSKIGIMLEFHICNKSLSSIEPEDLRHIMDVELELNRKSAPATIQKYMAIISNLFNIARKRWGMKLLENPYSVVDKPVVDNARERRFEGNEEQYLIAAMNQPWKNKNEYLLPMTLFALETTQRIGEILDMKWTNINIDKRLLTSSNKDTTGKNKNTIKYIPLSKRALKILSELKTMEAYKPDGHVFPTTYTAIQQAFDKACKRACKRACKHTADYKIGNHNKCDCNGIENFIFHDLRHEAISRLFENTNLRTEVIMKITGHKTYSMLHRYLHLRVNKATADALDYSSK